MEQYNIFEIEMEAANLYGVAAQLGAKALTNCTVSDHIRQGRSISGDERQCSLNDGITLSLKTAIAA